MRSRGAIVHELDTSAGFTAARARNAGWRLLLTQFPQVVFVQFIDGDCTLTDGWLAAAESHLMDNPRTAAVCGWRRERFPEQSIYNQLCDIEWNGPAGTIEEFGGGLLIRREALEQVQGYVDSVIAAEDTEFSGRLRQVGWTLTRLPLEMELHDAQMLKFSQWWKRAVRSGHANAEMHHRHGASPLHLRSRQARSNWFWGLIVPLIALGFAGVTGGRSLLLMSVYLVQYVRILVRAHRAYSWSQAHQYALFCVLGKFPEMIGQVKFHGNRLRGRQTTLIEYKGPPVTARALGT